MWIVKIGGSLFTGPYLQAWLVALAGCGRDVLVVPGGGPFADAVRAAQGQLGFSDEAAHVMALDAMRQSGTAMADLCAGLAVANGLESAQACGTGARIWLPLPQDARVIGLPASWAVTSDSLAVWVAQRVRADGLLLIKSAEPPRPTSLERCVDAAFVDGFFASASEGFAGALRWARADEAATLCRLLDGSDGDRRTIAVPGGKNRQLRVGMTGLRR